MEEMYGFQSAVVDYGDKSADYADRALMTPENLILPMDYQSLLSSGAFRDHRVPMMFGSDVGDLYSAISSAPEFRRGGDEDVFGAIKAKIASHPSYPRLVEAYIDCQKVKPNLPWLIQLYILSEIENGLVAFLWFISFNNQTRFPQRFSRPRD